MKILYFSNNYGATTTTFIRNEVVFFDKILDTKYLCNSYVDSYEKPNFLEIIPFVNTKFGSIIQKYLWKYDILCSFKNKLFSDRIYQFINNFNPDIIHCHFGYEALMLLDNLKEIEKYKIVIHFHGYDASLMTNKYSYCKKIRYYLSKKNIYIISVNKYFIDHFNNNLNFDVSRSFVLKCGIDTENIFQRKEKFTKRQGEIIFAQVSSLVEKKGHKYSIDAFYLFKKSNPNINVKMIFTGEGSEKQNLIDYSYRLGLENEIQFVGNLNPSEVACLLNNADVFIHHSVTSEFGDKEGIPTSIMEAMAMELPILSTYHSGIPELIEDGINGYLVKEKDINSYALKMFDVLSMGKLPQNRIKILTEYSLKLHNTILYEIYNKVYAEKNVNK